MLKHAYLIIANQKFSQLKFLLRTLDDSQIVAELYLFKKAISRQSYFYYHLLSGQDLPLYSQSYIHSFFWRILIKYF